MHEFVKGLWLLLSSVIFSFPCWQLRRLLLKATLGHFGKHCFFLRGIAVTNPQNVFVGDHVVINKKVMLDGRFAKLVIGNNVDIAQETNIWTLEHDVNDDCHCVKGGEVVIDDYVWIASRVTILPNVHIGKGAVVAAGAVVTKDIPSMEIWGGVPARKIGVRRNSLTYKNNYSPWFQ